MKATFLPILSHVSKSDGFDFFLSDTFLNLDGPRFTHSHNNGSLSLSHVSLKTNFSQHFSSILSHFSVCFPLALSSVFLPLMAENANAATGLDAVEVTLVPSASRKPRNFAGNRSDVAWQHGVSVDGEALKIQCKFCHKIVSGGVYRFKHHLAGTQKDTGACLAVPEEVKKVMLVVVTGLQSRLIQKTRTEVEDELQVGEKRKTDEVEFVGSPSNIKDMFKKRGFSSQPTINNVLKKELKEDAYKDIARFFYNNAIPFNAARSEEFSIMLDSVSRHGIGFKPPSYNDIRVKYLKQQVIATNDDLALHRATWKKVGCTIMTDGWTDKSRRSIINFLVNSPRGSVFLKSIDASAYSKTADRVFKMIDAIVEEVGEENVIQVVTDNAANYKSAGEKLMEKRKSLYWTPCAAHCIDLMLEDLGKNIPIHQETIPKAREITVFIYKRTSLITLLHRHTKGKDLVRPGLTRFATSYLTMRCLYENKGALIRMLADDEWKKGGFVKMKGGRSVEDAVMDRNFWKNIAICLKGAGPLIKVLRLVDSDGKPAMGYIYEAMDQAKENIQKEFNGVKTSYMPIWNIIDARWDRQLHKPLHAVGYFLNPELHFGPHFKVDKEVKSGVLQCIERMVPDLEEQTLIDVQMDAFHAREGLFGKPMAIRAIGKKTPAAWWESYGDEHPELQKFAIRVLSLTCSSSGCERNWSAFEMVHTKKRNRLKQKTMNDLVFVMANSKLNKKKQFRRPPEEIKFDDVSSDEEWINENDANPNEVELEDDDGIPPDDEVEAFLTSLEDEDGRNEDLLNDDDFTFGDF